MTALTITKAADQVEQAWQRIKDARAGISAIPDDDIGTETEAENNLWEVFDAAECAIRESETASRRHAEIKLWCAFLHSVNIARDESDVLAEDFDALSARDTSFDWNARLILSAIRSLRKPEA